jgi:hypothetical protein
VLFQLGAPAFNESERVTSTSDARSEDDPELLLCDRAASSGIKPHDDKRDRKFRGDSGLSVSTFQATEKHSQSRSNAHNLSVRRIVCIIHAIAPRHAPPVGE